MLPDVIVERVRSAAKERIRRLLAPRLMLQASRLRKRGRSVHRNVQLHMGTTDTPGKWRVTALKLLSELQVLRQWPPDAIAGLLPDAPVVICAEHRDVIAYMYEPPSLWIAVSGTVTARGPEGGATEHHAPCVLQAGSAVRGNPLEVELRSVGDSDLVVVPRQVLLAKLRTFTPEQRQRITADWRVILGDRSQAVGVCSALRRCPFFKDVPDQKLQHLGSQAEPLTVGEGDVLYAEGYSATAMLLLRRGITDWVCLGALACIFGETHEDTLLANGMSEVWSLPRRCLGSIMREPALRRAVLAAAATEREREMAMRKATDTAHREFLSSCMCNAPVLREVSTPRIRRELLSRLVPRACASKDTIVSSTDICDRLVIFVKGRATVHLQDGSSHAYKEGECTGYTCLAQHRWLNTVVAQEACRWYELPREALVRVLREGGQLSVYLAAMDAVLAPPRGARAMFDNGTALPTKQHTVPTDNQHALKFITERCPLVAARSVSVPDESTTPTQETAQLPGRRHRPSGFGQIIDPTERRRRTTLGSPVPFQDKVQQRAPSDSESSDHDRPPRRQTTASPPQPLLPQSSGLGGAALTLVSTSSGALSEQPRQADVPKQLSTDFAKQFTTEWSRQFTTDTERHLENSGWTPVPPSRRSSVAPRRTTLHDDVPVSLCVPGAPDRRDNRSSSRGSPFPTRLELSSATPDSDRGVAWALGYKSRPLRRWTRADFQEPERKVVERKDPLSPGRRAMLSFIEGTCAATAAPIREAREKARPSPPAAPAAAAESTSGEGYVVLELAIPPAPTADPSGVLLSASDTPGAAPVQPQGGSSPWRVSGGRASGQRCGRWVWKATKAKLHTGNTRDFRRNVAEALMQSPSPGRSARRRRCPTPASQRLYCLQGRRPKVALSAAGGGGDGYRIADRNLLRRGCKLEDIAPERPRTALSHRPRPPARPASAAAARRQGGKLRGRYDPSGKGVRWLWSLSAPKQPAQPTPPASPLSARTKTRTTTGTESFKLRSTTAATESFKLRSTLPDKTPSSFTLSRTPGTNTSTNTPAFVISVDNVDAYQIARAKPRATVPQLDAAQLEAQESPRSVPEGGTPQSVPGGGTPSWLSPSIAEHAGTKGGRKRSAFDVGRRSMLMLPGRESPRSGRRFRRQSRRASRRASSSPRKSARPSHVEAPVTPGAPPAGKRRRDSPAFQVRASVNSAHSDSTAYVPGIGAVQIAAPESSRP
eukprot:TRINITY_DN6124_c1_g1_i1.p1 TRINITY_DN6124_c1_g1~~TRINITY_DN6124_c1_g1_i1.p1  ORF type:complete len:1225 (+),score=329.95 TRINITY_DN6124_c1_g1_i1:274-3948(+)